MSQNPNDEIRERMLQFFYRRNVEATSVRGKRGSQARISDLKRELKELHGLSQAQVVSNLTYLIDRGWVTHYEEKKTFTTRQGTAQPSTVDWYGISAAGVDKIEGDSSDFRPRDPFAGINVTAIGSTVQVGDGNYVHAEYGDLHTELEQLREAIAQSDEIDDSQKVDAIANIEGLKLQLAKQSPDRTIIDALWAPIHKVATVAGLAAHATAIAARFGGLA